MERKLTKSQRVLLDRMAQGWTLWTPDRFTKSYMLCEPGKDEPRWYSAKTIEALADAGLVEISHAGMNRRCELIVAKSEIHYDGTDDDGNELCKHCGSTWHGHWDCPSMR